MKTSVLPFLLFFSLFFAVYGGSHFYVFWRLVHDAKISGFSFRLLLCVFILLFISFPVFHFALRHHNSSVINTANYISSVWMGFLTYLFLVTFAFDLILLFVHFFNFILPLDLMKYVPDSGKRAVIITVLASLVCIYGAIEAAMISVKEYKIVMPGLAIEKNPFRIVQISDLHLGVIVNGRRLERIVKTVNSLNPDVIVITGDLLDEQAFEIRDIDKPLKKLKSVYGVFAVTGNHEFFAGIERASAFMKSVGIDLLRNRWVSIGNTVQIAGMDDPAARYTGNNSIPHLKDILTGIDKNKPVILLYHTPVTTFEELAENGVGLQLSGHTHRGQLWPFRYFAKMMYKTPYGLFTSGNTHIYVSNGTGTWGPPMRVGARPEVTLFELNTQKH